MDTPRARGVHDDPMAVAARRAAPAALLAAIILLVYAPVWGEPPRIWDHHAVLLLVRAPQYREGLAGRLLNYRLGEDDRGAYLRVGSMPLVWAMSAAAGSRWAVHSAVHLACHWGVCLVLLGLVRDLSGSRALALLLAACFAVFSGHMDTPATPFWVFVSVAMLLGGSALRCLLRGRPVAAAALLAGATLFYDAFAPAAVLLPVLAQGPLRRRLDAALAVLAVLATVYALGAGMRPKGALKATAAQAARLALPALGRAAQAPLYDLLVFSGARLPAQHKNGNIIDWQVESLDRRFVPAVAACALMAGGGWLAARAGWPALLLSLAGLLLEPRAAPCAALLWACARGRPSPGTWTAAAAAVLCALAVALGREPAFALVGMRFHYLTAFFALAALAGGLRAAMARPASLLRGLVLSASFAAAALNAACAWAFVREVRSENRPIAEFRALLDDAAARHGARSLFMPHSLSRVSSPLWWGVPFRDVAFDVLAEGANPLTRHLHRAGRILCERAGTCRAEPNPRYGMDGGADFLFRFNLVRPLPRRPCEAYGTAPLEPRIVLQRGRLAFEARRLSDGSAVRWEFPLEPGKALAEVSLAREGRVLALSVEGRRTEARIGEGDDFHPWTSDNLDLLGRDFHELAVSWCVYDTYIRIGRSHDPSF